MASTNIPVNVMFSAVLMAHDYIHLKGRKMNLKACKGLETRPILKNRHKRAIQSAVREKYWGACKVGFSRHDR